MMNFRFVGFSIFSLILVSCGSGSSAKKSQTREEVAIENATSRVERAEKLSAELEIEVSTAIRELARSTSTFEENRAYIQTSLRTYIRKRMKSGEISKIEMLKSALISDDPIIFRIVTEELYGCSLDGMYLPERLAEMRLLADDLNSIVQAGIGDFSVVLRDRYGPPVDEVQAEYRDLNAQSVANMNKMRSFGYEPTTQTWTSSAFKAKFGPDVEILLQRERDLDLEFERNDRQYGETSNVYAYNKEPLVKAYKRADSLRKDLEQKLLAHSKMKEAEKKAEEEARKKREEEIRRGLY